MFCCAQITVKEAVVDDHDVVRGLLEFANRNLIQSIVVGASTKNSLTRFLSIIFISLVFQSKFIYRLAIFLTWIDFLLFCGSLKKLKGNHDIPTAMIKVAPDYCNVYIISKLKIMSARSAMRQFVTPKQQAFQASLSGESENSVRCLTLKLISNLLNSKLRL